MPLPDAVPIRMDWADENAFSEELRAEALLVELLHSEIVEAHEARCDRIARGVMMRLAELPAQAVEPS